MPAGGVVAAYRPPETPARPLGSSRTRSVQISDVYAEAYIVGQVPGRGSERAREPRRTRLASILACVSYVATQKPGIGCVADRPTEPFAFVPPRSRIARFPDQKMELDA